VNTLEVSTDRKIQTAWEHGFATYCETFPDAIRIVAREAAYQQFVKDCEGKAADSRFEKEGPNHALLLLCQEHLLHNHYTKG
jgi:hypothetical protein